MAELTPADRVLALLEWGDVGEADAAIEAAAAGATSADGAGADGVAGWQPLLWRGMRALMEGRFHACEQMVTACAEVGATAGDLDASVGGVLLFVSLRREQERLAEAETVLRSFLEGHPSAPAGAHALLALLVGEMGRDGQARVELGRLLPREPMPATGRLAPMWLLAELAAAVDAPDEEAALLYRRLLPHARDYAVEDGGAVFYGSVSLALGRLAQSRGAWNDAIGHYQDAEEAHRRVGAPILLAHAQRHLAALLRTRSGEDDWERAVALLSSAAGIYRHVGVDDLASKTQAVLARAEDGLGAAGTVAAGTVFRRQGEGWVVGAPDDPARLRDSPGLEDIARLLAAPGMNIHVADLVARADPRPGLPPYRPWATGAVRPWDMDGPVLDPETRSEYQNRLTELAAELVEAERAGDGIAAALARAERDTLVAALAEGDGDTEGIPADPVDLARRTVSTRIRISLDRIEQLQPGLGRHLRRSIRTGTFLSYDPDRRVRWEL